MLSMDDQGPSGLSQRAVSESLTSESEPTTLLKPPELEIRNSGRRFEIIGLISTLFVFAITSGTATLILGWLYTFHDPIATGGGMMSAVRNGTFAIMEPSGSAIEDSTSSQTHTQTLRILTFSALAVSR